MVVLLRPPLLVELLQVPTGAPVPALKVPVQDKPLHPADAFFFNARVVLAIVRNPLPVMMLKVISRHLAVSSLPSKLHSNQHPSALTIPQPSPI
jgi:hypothetical protein